MSDEALQEDVVVTRSETDIAVVTLNRPARLNALTRETVAQFNAALDALAQDDRCRAVILTGAGRGFCSGQDLVAADSRNKAQASGVVDKLFWQEQFASMSARLRAMPKLVVAAVNGPAVGAGMAIALSADVRIATSAARFLVAAVRIGLSGGESGISYLLPRLIGASRAFDILLTGRPIEPEEAQRIGLILKLVEPRDLLDEAIGYARTVLGNSPFSVAHTKKMMWENLDASFAAAIASENRTQILAAMTQDYREATAAFTEKREPRFEGR